MMNPPSVFISYSHKDIIWKNRLYDQLKVAEKQMLLSVWSDTQLEAGQNLLPEIVNAIDAAKVGVLLVSQFSLTSEFILRKEISRILERRQQQGMVLIPIIARHCLWTKVKWLKSMLARPHDGKPLESFTRQKADENLASIANEICSFATRAAQPAITTRKKSQKTPGKNPKIEKANGKSPEIDLKATFEICCQTDGSFIATSPQFPELLTAGDTMLEAAEDLPGALKLVLDFRKSKKRKIS